MSTVALVSRCVPGGQSVPSARVDLHRNGLKVRRVDAPTIAAEMVQRLGADVPNERYPHGPMGTGRNLAEVAESVAVAIAPSLPFPAASGAVLDH